LLLFALNTSRTIGEKIADALRVPLSPHEERDFEDGEHKIRPLGSVRGRNVYVIHSLYTDRSESVNDKICKLLFFIGALRDASAGRIFLVIPYFAYARKDRKTKARDPVSMRYMAQLLEAVGADHIVTMDIHNLAAFQNAFRIPTDHLEARLIFAPFISSSEEEDEWVVVSPDPGGVKRAEEFRLSLADVLGRDIDKAFLDKSRSEGVLSGDTLIGTVAGRAVIIIDDIISSGGTIGRAVNTLHQHGARRILAAATHGLFTGNAAETLANPHLEKVLVTDTIDSFRLAVGPARDKLKILSSANLLAEAIKRIDADGSLVQMMNSFPISFKDDLS
jgi:ribose-phosphate pyrophosphokinase